MAILATCFYLNGIMSNFIDKTHVFYYKIALNKGALIQTQIETHIDPNVISEFSYPLNPPFGTVAVPVVLWFDVSKSNPTPKKIHIETLKELSVSPFCSTLHYGQSIFEGLKAYHLKNNDVGIFRLDRHASRFSKSAEIMGMCSFSPELFIDSLLAYVKQCKDFVPKEKNHALYLRPLLFANDPVIKVHASESYRFMIMSSIVGDYFASGKKESRVLINKGFVRAFPGGTGEAKTSANYALSLRALEHAYSHGYDQVLYLDAITKTTIEELGGMNFFICRENEIATPKLNGQILKGVTRESILEISRELGIQSFEEKITLDSLITGQIDGSIQEVFASGTAAVVRDLAEIGVQETISSEIQPYRFPQSETSQKLRAFLTATQWGETDLSQKWLRTV